MNRIFTHHLIFPKFDDLQSQTKDNSKVNIAYNQIKTSKLMEIYFKNKIFYVQLFCGYLHS